MRAAALGLGSTLKQASRSISRPVWKRRIRTNFALERGRVEFRRIINTRMFQGIGFDLINGPLAQHAVLGKSVNKGPSPFRDDRILEREESLLPRLPCRIKGSFDSGAKDAHCDQDDIKKTKPGSVARARNTIAAWGQPV